MIGSWALVFWEHKMLAAGVAVWFTFKGWVRVSKGLTRERGIEVEWRAFVKFLHAMKPGEFVVQQDIPMMRRGICYGNVDMVVSPVWTQASFVVEIKSFSGLVRRWYGLCRLGKFYRLWSPQKQVRGQCRYMDARWHFPVLWLPESKLGTWMIVGGILVVNGDADLLIGGLKAFDEWIKKPVRVTFPRPPGDGVTVLKSCGGMVEWVGR